MCLAAKKNIHVSYNDIYLKFLFLTSKFTRTTKYNTAQQKIFFVFAIDISTILLYIRCADFENDLTFAELALVFGIIWIQLFIDYGYKISVNGRKILIRMNCVDKEIIFRKKELVVIIFQYAT